MCPYICIYCNRVIGGKRTCSGGDMAGDENEAPRIRRSSLKTLNSSYTNWKHKLRENCFKRVREDRTRLLWKLRLPEAVEYSSNHKNLVKSTLQDIVSDELRKFKESSLHEKYGAPTFDTKTDDMIWEDDALSSSYQGDYEEMLLLMERIFYEDLRTEKSRKESESECFIQTWEDEEDEYLARAVYEHMQLNSEQVAEELWCPICKRGKLQENYHQIYCSHCEVKLERGDEVNLKLLRQRLGDVHMEHLDRGCRQRPEFCSETKFCLTALYIKCQGCSTFEVVL
ncbi:hypothetical protein F511_34995 [Dorcoceras hygrometricum]|uniref:Uncharacterized protein n=1 Tax=Dorcoceras hygrometricum TaxID=472368 RepID=A0A2Z7B4P3_9LAMI|nr:hypothetical protein F511_34995 [Dorcoceras hygrometricum]